MNRQNTISRRGFLEAVAALGSLGLASCAANERQASRFSAANRTMGKLPSREEFVVRNAYVVTMDVKLGDIPGGDVHVRNGELIAVGPNLSAPGVEQIDGSNRIAVPGFVDTHFHLWGSFARGIVADGEFDYFPVMSRLGPAMTPDDAYNSARLGIAEAINSGLTTITTGRTILFPALMPTPIYAQFATPGSARAFLTATAGTYRPSRSRPPTSPILRGSRANGLAHRTTV